MASQWTWKMLDTAVSGSNTYSASASLAQYTGFSYSAIWTGTLVGTFDIQASNDGSNWASLGAVFPTVNGTPGMVMVDTDGISTEFCLLVYTNISGTGNLIITGTYKE